MKAINNYVVVEKTKVANKNIGGLIMTDTTDIDNSYDKGVIVSAGNLVEGLKNKDIIYYNKHAGHSITIDDNIYRVITSHDIVLVQ